MKIVQKAVIKDNDKYLILLRPSDKKSFPDHWDLPGGKVDKNENLYESIKREVLEETNLEIEILDSGKVFETTIKGVLNKFVTYEARVISGSVKISNEHVDFKWATLDEILELEKIDPFIEHYFKTSPKK